MKDEAGTLESQTVIEACEAAVAAGNGALEVQAAWSRTKEAPKARGDGQAVILDRQIDRVISGILRCAENIIQSLDPASDLVVQAKELVRRCHFSEEIP